MDSFLAFLQMGGRGLFIWSSYGITVVVMAGVLLASIRAARVREAELQVLRAGRPSRAPQSSSGQENLPS